MRKEKGRRGHSRGRGEKEEETGRVGASAGPTLRWRHVRGRGRAGPSRAWQQGAWEVSARAPARLLPESRAGRGRVSGVGGAGAGAQAQAETGDAEAVGGGCRKVLAGPARDCGGETGPTGRSGDRG